MLNASGLRDMGTLDCVYDRTGLCPHTEACESFRAILNCERWMEQALSGLRREGLVSLPKSEGGYSADSLQSHLGHVRRVKERCYSGNYRCLRFWQLERKKKSIRERWTHQTSPAERALDHVLSIRSAP